MPTTLVKLVAILNHIVGLKDLRAVDEKTRFNVRHKDLVRPTIAVCLGFVSLFD